MGHESLLFSFVFDLPRLGPVARLSSESFPFEASSIPLLEPIPFLEYFLFFFLELGHFLFLLAELEHFLLVELEPFLLLEHFFFLLVELEPSS